MSKTIHRFQVTKTIGHVELGPVLGQGGFGKVYLGFDTTKNEEVAVKFIDKKMIAESHIQEYVDREIEVMKKLKHRHVVALQSVVNSTKGYYLVMELASNGELFDKIVESKRFDENTARKYFQQLVSALKYCHDLDIVHRDLKAENLLLGADNTLRVCDFGLSRYVSAAQQLGSSGNGESKNSKATADQNKKDRVVVMTSLAGSVDYQAPEVIKEEGYQGFSCDVWSCGVILFFMVCGYLPFAARGGVSETQDRIIKCQYNKDNKYMSEGLRDLVKHILVVDPANRYSLRDVIRHPWFCVNLDRELFPDTAARLSPTTPSANLFLPDLSSPAAPLTPVTSDPSTLDYRDKLHAAFSSVNYDHSGFLSRRQVKDMLVKIRDAPVSDAEVDEFISNFDHDENGYITEEQFVIGWTRNERHIESQLNLVKLINLFHYDLEVELLNTLHAAFDRLDATHNGIVTESDLRALATELEITDDECGQLMSIMNCEQRPMERSASDALLHHSHHHGSGSTSLTDSHVGHGGSRSSHFHPQLHVPSFRLSGAGSGPSPPSVAMHRTSSTVMSEFPGSPICPSSPLHSQSNNGNSNNASAMAAAAQAVPAGSGEGTTPPSGTASSSGSSANKKITFDKFVEFCTKGSLMSTNPIARRLNRVREMFDVTESIGYKNFLSTGFSVSGLRETIISKLVACGPDHFTVFERSQVAEGFVYGAYDGPGPLCHYGSARGYPAMLMMTPSNMSGAASPASFSLQAPTRLGAHHSNNGGTASVGVSPPQLGGSLGSLRGDSFARSPPPANGPNGPSGQTPQNGNNSNSPVARVHLNVGVQLLPAATGYTKIKAYRISGKTEVFHAWFRLLREMLRSEIQACEEDTAVVGESELM